MRKIYLIIPFIFIILGTAAQTPDKEKKNIREIKQKFHKQGDELKLLEERQASKRNIGKKSSKNWEHGDAPAWEWSQDLGGSGWDQGNDVIVDDNGNYYVAGSFSGEISYGDSSYTASGLRDGFIAKFNSNGDLQWFRHIEPSAHERVDLKGIHIDTDGNLYSTGYFSGSINSGNISLTGENRQNFLLLKLNGSGEVSFAKTHDTNDDYMPGKTVQTDSDGNIYALTSHYILKYDASGSLLWEMAEAEEIFNDFKLVENSLYYVGYVINQTGSIGSVNYSMDGNQNSDMFLAKSDKHGNFSFVKLPKHSSDYGFCRAFDISTDQHKNLYITANFEDIVLGEDTLSGASEQALVVKFDTTGTAKWATKLPFTGTGFPLTTSADSITYIIDGKTAYKCDSDGNLQISGDSINSRPNALNFDNNTGSVITAGNKDGALYISDLNSSLDETENIEFNSNSASARISGMVADDQGNFYVYGSCINTIDYHGTSISEGVFFAKHDANGNLLWVKNIPKAETDSDIGDAITLDPQDQNIFITGDFYEEINIPGGGSLTPDNDGSMFVLKYDTGGNFIWSNKIDDLLFNNADLTTDYSGNVILTNPFNNTIDISNETYTSEGDDDIITIKFDQDGNIKWAIQAGGETKEYGAMTSVDENDNIYFTGEFPSKNVVIGDSSVTLNEGDGNILLVKMSPDGVVQWTTSHAGSVSENSYDSGNWPTGIKTLPNGYSYIKGWHSDSVAFSDTILANKYGWDLNYFIGKFNPEGEAVWVNSIDQEYFGFDYNQMDVDEDGNVYFGAQARDKIHFKHYEEEYTYEPVGRVDLFVAQYTSDGDIGWIKTIESRYGANSLYSVAVSDKYNIYASGYYIDYISFGNTEHYSENLHGFITKMAKNQPPTNITLSNDTIIETALVGTEVGVFSTEDQDEGDEHTYALVSGDGSNDSDNVRFAISGNILVTDAEFDYDTQKELNIYVQTKDTADHTYEKEFVIHVAEDESDDETAVNNIQNSPFKIYPNPASDNLVISNSEAEGDKVRSIRIVSMEGRTLHTIDSEGGQLNRVNIAHIPAGVYIVEIQTVKESYRGRLIKE